MKLYPAEKLNLGLSAGAVATSLALATPLFAGSLAFGATLGSVNFRFLHTTAEGVFQGAVQSSAWVVVLAFRLALVFAGICAAMLLGADAMGLLIGLSIVMPATVAAAVWLRPAHVPTMPGPAVAPDDPIWDDYSVWRPDREIKRKERRSADDDEAVLHTVQYREEQADNNEEAR